MTRVDSARAEPVGRREPEEPVPAGFDVRAELAARCLRGSGLEIGALSAPLPVPADVRVRYVDRMSVSDLRRHYPELAEAQLVDVDVVDDGETLASVPDGSQDFVIANHFLEHTADPITTIETHLRKLAPGGMLFYAVPDKRFTFDVRRDVTSIEHMMADRTEGPQRSRRQHYEEWVRYVYDPAPPEDDVPRLAAELDASDYSIHTHVWTQAEFLALVLHCRELFERGFDVEAVWKDGNELLVVLRKAGEPRVPPGIGVTAGAGEVGAYIVDLRLGVEERDRELKRQRRIAAESHARLTALHRSPSWRFSRPLRAAERLRRRAAAELEARRARGLTTVSVASLRPDLDGGWPEGARWLPRVEIAGEARAALEQPAGTTAAIPLLLPAGARLRAHVALPLLAWHDHGGGAELRATLREPGGRKICSWSQSLGTVVTGDASRWVALGGPIPDAPGPREALLTLAVAATGDPFERRAIRAGLWGDLAIVVPADEGVDPLPAREGAAVVPAGAAAPRFSILTPVHDPDPAFLEQLIAHVRWQTHADWELCVVDDGSRDAQVRALLSRAAEQDERIRVQRHDEAAGISAATNAALAMARGDWVALLDHDDVLASDALGALAQALAAHPEADMLYTDEDHVLRTGRRYEPYRKPDWSPELFRSLMFTGHLAAYRRTLALELGGFRSELDGSQDYDFVLRLSERTDRIVHVPRVVYHWRVHERSAAAGADAKPYAYEAARRALDEHLSRTGIAATAEATDVPGEYRISHEVDPASSVALLLALDAAAVADERLPERLAMCVRSWLRSTHAAWELVVAVPAASAAAIEQMFAAAGGLAERTRVVPVNGRDAAGRIGLVNCAAAATDADCLLWTDGPMEVDERAEDWLERLLGYAVQPGVGAVGGKVLAPDGRVEHAGVVLGGGLALPAHHGAPGDAAGHLGNLRVAANWSAVSGVVMTTRATFAELGGLDASFGTLAEVDYCLRLRERGSRIVLVPDALLHRREALPPARNDVAALARLRRRWAAAILHDPYYNPGFWQGSGAFTPLELVPD
ncbi:MAG: glycosyltransferase [Conexibacter sp.]